MEFILELNTEEMPPAHVKAALVQLEERFKEQLLSQNVERRQIKTYGTCRRLVVTGYFSPTQKDREEEFIGPPKAVGMKQDGSFSSAAKGFAKSQGVRVSELKVIKTAKGEYLGLKKIERGMPTRDILSEILPQIVSSLSFPKMMRWGESSFRFSRPIKNILCLFGGKKLSFSIEGIRAGNSTTGHKIYFPKKIKVRSFKEYREALKKMKVVIDQEERRKMILSQIGRKLTSLKAELHPDEGLLERLVYDIEYPYVILGSFPEEYLELPLEVLSTAMREGQKLFSIVKEKKQQPFFLGVADAYQDSKSLIRKGNERVLKARLDDAKFFWEQDRKATLRKKAKALDKIVFQEKLGSYEDKTQRLKKIVSYLADKIEATKEKKQVIQAAELSKVDLLTEMVREFPSLQGNVGGLYAREEKYPALVWKAVYEHYQPVSLDDEPPASLTGAILSIADRLDSIVGVIGTGITVTGSKDPFGLRRNAQGVCKVIIERKLCLSFMRLLDKVIAIYGERLQEPKEKIKSYCLDFFSNRLRYIFERQGYRYDLVNASVSAGIDNLYHSYLRLIALDSLKDSPSFEPLIIIAKRVNNILKDQPLFKVNQALLAEKEERELYTTFSIIKNNIIPLISKGDFSQAQRIIFRIRSSINSFFDNVLVMTDEVRMRRNRLALLQAISKLLIQVADYSQIVIEGQDSPK
ncbi:MAG: glycine--tRNA ligase subunit beta [Candidatus Aminicenantes bacterium]|nr:glycine--tRNA ligase subunit beta [Candidatus Aminicenantes bacterium]